jgi:uncharacterized protein YkwD
MRRITVIRIFCALIIVVLCAFSAAEGRERQSRVSRAAKAAGEEKPRIDAARLEKRIHDLVNQERKKKGLSALAWNGDLNRIARRYSRDMAERRFFSHNDPEGKCFTDRYKDEGFECKLRIGNTTCLGAENIAQDNLYRSTTVIDGRTSHDWNTEEEIALSVVKGWMGSKGHRENIMTPYFKRQGIGIAISDDGKVYVTENFC